MQPLAGDVSPGIGDIVGIWLCPWHHCAICGKAALYSCYHCPNSYCDEHWQGYVTFLPERNENLCLEHPDSGLVPVKDTTPIEFFDDLPTQQVDDEKLKTEGSDEAEGTGHLVNNIGKSSIKRRHSRSLNASDWQDIIRNGDGQTTDVSHLRDDLVDVSNRSPFTADDCDDLRSESSNEGRLTIVEEQDPVKKRQKSNHEKLNRGRKPTATSTVVSSSSRLASKSRARGRPSTKRTLAAISDAEKREDDSASSLPTRRDARQLAAEPSLDSLMFDNSDDEFPELVIDVPT